MTTKALMRDFMVEVIKTQNKILKRDFYDRKRLHYDKQQSQFYVIVAKGLARTYNVYIYSETEYLYIDDKSAAMLYTNKKPLEAKLCKSYYRQTNCLDDETRLLENLQYERIKKEPKKENSKFQVGDSAYKDLSEEKLEKRKKERETLVMDLLNQFPDQSNRLLLSRKESLIYSKPIEKTESERDLEELKKKENVDFALFPELDSLMNLAEVSLMYNDEYKIPDNISLGTIDEILDEFMRNE
jgi:hypothetical protein